LISIAILSENMKTSICHCVHELTLVHELLHCKFTLTDGMKDTAEGQFASDYEHMLVDQTAKSLLMTKYEINIDWFKNF